MRFATIMLLAVGCGKAPLQVNPCVTKGATYFLHYAEANNGTCGALPDVIVNIDKDGLPVGAEKLSCEASTVEGCTGKNTNCTNTVDGTTCTATTSVEYTKDGSAGGGLATISCKTASSSCLSTYQVTAVRQ